MSLIISCVSFATPFAQYSQGADKDGSVTEVKLSFFYRSVSSSFSTWRSDNSKEVSSKHMYGNFGLEEHTDRVFAMTIMQLSLSLVACLLVLFPFKQVKIQARVWIAIFGLFALFFALNMVLMAVDRKEIYKEMSQWDQVRFEKILHKGKINRDEFTVSFGPALGLNLSAGVFQTFIFIFYFFFECREGKSILKLKGKETINLMYHMGEHKGNWKVT